MNNNLNIERMLQEIETKHLNLYFGLFELQKFYKFCERFNLNAADAFSFLASRVISDQIYTGKWYSIEHYIERFVEEKGLTDIERIAIEAEENNNMLFIQSQKNQNYLNFGLDGIARQARLAYLWLCTQYENKEREEFKAYCIKKGFEVIPALIFLAFETSKNIKGNIKDHNIYDHILKYEKFKKLPVKEQNEYWEFEIKSFLFRFND